MSDPAASAPVYPDIDMEVTAQVARQLRGIARALLAPGPPEDTTHPHDPLTPPPTPGPHRDGTTAYAATICTACASAIRRVVGAGPNGATIIAFASAVPLAGKTHLITPPDLAIWHAGVGRTWSSPTRSDPEGSSRNDFAAGRSGSHHAPGRARLRSALASTALNTGRCNLSLPSRQPPP